ncbi:MAG: S41 family peptidase [Defluviitaleaceae bacterium]|nr:S41 family peptidase [Defluviitaleaceae bacterium]
MIEKIKNWFKNKKVISEEKLRRRYRALKVCLFLMLGLFGFTVYANYDYWVFKLLIANNYVLTDALDELYSRHILPENRRGFHRDFDRVVISVVTGQLSEINNDRFTYLYAPQQIRAVREADRAIARTASIEAINEDTVLLFIPNISRATRQFVQNNRDYLAQYPNLIFDLRGNYGGWLADFHRIADLFVPQGAIIAFEETRMPMFTRTITASNDAFFEFRNIVILQNNRTASSAEGLILALSEHVPEVVTLGETTFGKGIGQVTIPLTRGYAVRATVLNVLGPQGQSIHQIGIAPDIEADPDIDWVEQALGIARK